MDNRQDCAFLLDPSGEIVLSGHHNLDEFDEYLQKARKKTIVISLGVEGLRVGLGPARSASTPVFTPNPQG